MRALVLVFLVIMWIVILLSGGRLWADASLGLRDAWEVDHEELFCARLSAMEANLEAGLAMWTAKVPEETPALEAARAAAVELWSAERRGCEEPHSFELYRQKNADLPQGYPNWWVRFRSPDSS